MEQSHLLMSVEKGLVMEKPRTESLKVTHLPFRMLDKHLFSRFTESYGSKVIKNVVGSKLGSRYRSS